MVATMNNTQIESTEREVYEFLFHQIGLGIPFEQIETFFKAEDLTIVKELWVKAESMWEQCKGYEDWNCNGEILIDEKWEGM